MRVKRQRGLGIKMKNKILSSLIILLLFVLNTACGYQTENDPLKLNKRSGNADPVIEEFTSSIINPHPGQIVTLTVVANDPDGDLLGYAYEYTAGSGTILNSGSSSTAMANNTGSNTITVTVDDGHGGQTTKTLDLTGVNVSPIISSFNASTNTIFNNGTDTKTLAVIASDADGDDITYSYSVITGVGTVSGNSTSGTFTSGKSGGMSTVRVTVSDPYGGTATPDLQIKACGPNSSSASSEVISGSRELC